MRLIRWVGLFGSTLLCCCASGPSIAQEPEAGVILRPEVDERWEQSYVLSVITESTQRSARIPRGARRQIVERSAGISWQVVQLSDQETHLRARYAWLSLKINIDLPQIKLQFDSRDPPADESENPLAPLLTPLIGLEFDVYIDDEGEILAIQFPQGVAPMGRFANLAQSFTDADSMIEELRPIFTLGAGPLPVRPGESWDEVTVRQLSDLGIDIRRNQKATIDQVTDAGLAEVTVIGTLSVERARNAQVARAQAQQAEVEGKASWNTVAGRLESFEERSTLGLVAEPQPGQVWRLEAITTMTLSREE